ncbi:O-antigen ligase family protein [Flavobacterium proteolyticum]|uniref:O-antigen ligase family protein n=1 Tax=Flavobacterium proteolyticum TaxID=2911683 RepID=A0ABR9WQE6_9FLAO|nr:O-antigen ligase family protein [Flavobacterium proteolyticum]MBE9575744.1 O-antigen ligase family protein [Flavobacterium proteolyticum]
MNNIYSFLSNVWKELLEENKQNKAFIPFLLLLITLPISMAVNNILLGVFFLSSLLYIRKNKFVLSVTFLIPILLFVWMCVSYFWSIDLKRTLSAIPKEIALLLLPIAFMLIPTFTKEQKDRILKYYSYTMLIYVVFFLIRALIRFLITKDTSVFFYHGPDNETDTGLVPRLLNAIHVSVYVSIAFFYFFIKEHKTKWEQAASILLFVFVILLSSKNIILVLVLLILIQVFFYSKIANRLRLRNLTIILILLGFIVSFSKIKERFLVEFRTNSDKSISHNVALNKSEGINNISIADAWTKEQFHPSDYFPGTAFRVYQFRMFTEFLEEDVIFWKGFGLNASLNKLLEKEKQYNLYPGYGTFNFHNQYVQNFAELGVVGFLLLLIILYINTKKAFGTKDFMHIAFAVLMISLFLTESFLWRQRGVLFFMVLYCLFNAESTSKLEKK